MTTPTEHTPQAHSREKRLASAFVTLADTLVAGYDVVDLLQTLVDTTANIFDASAAGLMLADADGELSVVASTSEERHLVDLMQLRYGYGPCVECYRTGEVIALHNVDRPDSRWPDFNAGAEALGFHSVFVFPLRLRGEIIGSLTLFRSTTSVMEDEDIQIAQGLADVATIGILHERAIRESDLAKEQLQRALNSRVVIEQAKGVLAQTRSVGMDEAFTILRSYARGNGLKLHDVAEQIVTRTLNL